MSQPETFQLRQKEIAMNLEKMSEKNDILEAIQQEIDAMNEAGNEGSAVSLADQAMLYIRF
jgi:hypothetical protein